MGCCKKDDAAQDKQDKAANGTPKKEKGQSGRLSRAQSKSAKTTTKRASVTAFLEWRQDQKKDVSPPYVMDRDLCDYSLMGPVPHPMDLYICKTCDMKSVCVVC